MRISSCQQTSARKLVLAQPSQSAPRSRGHYCTTIAGNNGIATGAVLRALPPCRSHMLSQIILGHLKPETQQTTCFYLLQRPGVELIDIIPQIPESLLKSLLVTLRHGFVSCRGSSVLRLQVRCVTYEQRAVCGLCTFCGFPLYTCDFIVRGKGISIKSLFRYSAALSKRAQKSTNHFVFFLRNPTKNNCCRDVEQTGEEAFRGA